MESKITFGKREATAFLINAINTQIFLTFPRVMTEVAGNASWILSIYISLIAFILFVIISKLYTKFEGKDLLDISEMLGGTIVRVVVGLAVIAEILFTLSITLRKFSEDVKVIELPFSPISFVNGFFVIAIIIAAYFGLEAIVRVNAIFVPITIVGFFLIILGVIPYFHFDNLLPIFGAGIPDILGKGSLKISMYSSLIYLFFITPFLKTKENFKSVGFTVLGLSSVFMTLSCFIFVGVISYPTSLESFIPFYDLARLIHFGDFFQRIESVFVIIWVLSAMLYMSTAFFFLVYIFKKTFKLQYYKPIIMPFIIIVFCTSIFPQSLMNTIFIETNYLRSFGWVVTFGVTIVLLVVANIVKKKHDKGAVRYE